jgi:hypothetical protein
MMDELHQSPGFAALTPRQREDARRQAMEDLAGILGQPLPNQTQKKPFGLIQEQAFAGALSTERP